MASSLVTTKAMTFLNWMEWTSGAFQVVFTRVMLQAPRSVTARSEELTIRSEGLVMHGV